MTVPFIHKTIFPKELGITGRSLLHKEDKLFVLSECCDALINGDDHEGVYSAFCGLCTAFLTRNPERWSQTIYGVDGIDQEDGETWARWGFFWFGVEEFGMELEK